MLDKIPITQENPTVGGPLAITSSMTGSVSIREEPCVLSWTVPFSLFYGAKNVRYVPLEKRGFPWRAFFFGLGRILCKNSQEYVVRPSFEEQKSVNEQKGVQKQIMT